jgi:predicted enzyme related to lactoylglutathione lyase
MTKLESGTAAKSSGSAREFPRKESDVERYKTHGDFSWCELMSRNVQGSKKFYAELLGWQLEDMPMKDGRAYTVVKAGGRSVGGIMPMPPDAPKEVPPYWGSYVTVDDVDAVAKKVPQLGGKIIVPPMDIPDVGRFCTFMDSEGAVLSVIRYEQR